MRQRIGRWLAQAHWRRLVVALGACLCLNGCTSPPQYTLRGDAPVGTGLGQGVGEGGGVPLNRRYEELSDGEKLQVREAVARYDSRLGPDGEPPFPLDGLKPVYRGFHAGYQEFVHKWRYRYPWQGAITLIATVQADGAVIGVVQRGLAPVDLSSTVAGVVRRTKFKPAICRGQPCQMSFPFSVDFVVKDADSSGRFR